MKINIASRTSPLALVQTEQIIAALKKIAPDLTFNIVPILTQGDKIQDHSLATLGGKGLFIKGLEEALIAKKADIAMHSLKDVPPRLEKSFCIPAVLKRESPHDVLVSQRYGSIGALAVGALIGTSSVRRRAALLSQRPDVEVRMIRGNVDTRLKKLDQREFDALILAEAGLARLGLETRITERLSVDIFTPSVGQGVIAVECLSAREDLITLLKKINDPETFSAITAERAMNAALQAACTSPVGSYAQIEGENLILRGCIWGEQYKIETKQTGLSTDAERIGQAAAADLIRQGARCLLNI